MESKKILFGVLGATGIILGTFSNAEAKPPFAAKEGVKCSYCHAPAPPTRNYRGKYYGMHNLSFAGFDDAAEAKKAGVAIGAEAESKPKSQTAPEPVMAPKMEKAMDKMEKKMDKGMDKMDKAMSKMGDEDDEYASKPYSIQLGLSSLLNGNSRKATSSTGTHFTLGYALSGGSALINVKDKPAKASIDLTINSASGKGNKLSSTGIFYTSRIPLSENDEGTGLYAGLGIGLVNVSSKVKLTSTTSVSKSKTNLGINLLVGKPLSGGLTVEAGYQIAGSVKGAKADSLKLAVGYRF
jgi:opacity protein-like surface antigen